MATKKKKLAKVKCVDCKRINYFMDKMSDADRKLEMKKFCKWCKKHTVHKEGK